MAEIERKFLVEEMPRAESGQTEIEQGYLALGEDSEVRLRRAGDELFLTAKSGSGEVREEVEVTIEPRAFESLWPLTAGGGCARSATTCRSARGCGPRSTSTPAS